MRHVAAPAPKHTKVALVIVAELDRDTISSVEAALRACTKCVEAAPRKCPFSRI